MPDAHDSPLLCLQPLTQTLPKGRCQPPHQQRPWEGRQPHPHSPLPNPLHPQPSRQQMPLLLMPLQTAMLSLQAMALTLPLKQASTCVFLATASRCRVRCGICKGMTCTSRFTELQRRDVATATSSHCPAAHECLQECAPKAHDNVTHFAGHL